MMSDAIDDAIDDDEAEDETEELTNQVCMTFYFKKNEVIEYLH